MGAVLQQNGNNTLRPLEFFSKTFNRTQHIRKRTPRHILNSPILSTTARRQVFYFMNRRIQWLSFISQFTTNGQYQAGKENLVAGTLSKIEEICVTKNFATLVQVQEHNEELAKLMQQPNLEIERIRIPGTETNWRFLTLFTTRI